MELGKDNPLLVQMVPDGTASVEVQYLPIVMLGHDYVEGFVSQGVAVGFFTLSKCLNPSAIR